MEILRQFCIAMYCEGTAARYGISPFKEIIHCLDVLGLGLVKIIKLGELDVKLAVLKVRLNNTSVCWHEKGYGKDLYN